MVDKQKPTIAVVGSINMDLAITMARVPRRGENVLADDLEVGLGGKGANPSVALSRLGASSLLVGCVGDDDFGRQALETLRGEGVDTGGIQMLEDVSTGVALIMVDQEGENTIAVVIGANAALTPGWIEKALAPHWDYLQALAVNFEIPQDCVAAVIREGRRHGLPVVVDAGPPRDYGSQVWGGATVLSPNTLEAEKLVGYALEDEATARRAVRDLLAQGPEAVVLKWGAKGALLCTSGTERLISGFSVDVVDTTGAGDAFTAGLTFSLAQGKTLPEAVRFANAAGAMAVTRMGTMRAMPTYTEVEALLQERS